LSIADNGVQFGFAVKDTCGFKVLDEATSALDTESELFVQNTLKKLKQDGKTIILIAHRLNTVVNADKIVLIEKGKLIEEGNHEELYRKKGKYYRMWQQQFPMLNKNFQLTKP
jgi:ATP-binding cassette subfamily B protein